jgi:hypothetical protein
MNINMLELRDKLVGGFVSDSDGLEVVAVHPWSIVDI